jgi:hypothetical protein
MKTLGAIAIVICLLTAGCGYHDRYARRDEIRRANEDFRRGQREAREDFQHARREFQRDLRDARDEFHREMRDARREFHDEFDHR